MLQVTITGLDAVVTNLQGLADRTRPAIVGALNAAISSTRTVMASEIATDIGLDESDVQDQLTVRQASATQLSAAVSAKLKRIPLITFGASGPEPSRGQGAGVSYRLRGGRAQVPSGFIATMRSGHKGVFARVGTSTRESVGAWSKNLPIHELHGPSIGKVFDKHRAAGVAAAEQSFREHFDITEHASV
jgi:hypothetical protein